MALRHTTNADLSVEELVSDLSRGCAFPVHVDQVTVRQTHISLVFIGGDVVYKVKKNLKLPFLDFSTLQLRHHYCHEEVRINQPWAPDVYLCVVPVTRSADGLVFEGSGPAVEWTVKMRRLPESATLRARLRDQYIDPLDLERVARRIAATHKSITSVASNLAIKANTEFHRYWSENWEFASGLNAEFIVPEVLQKLLKLSKECIARHEAGLIQRAKDGMIKDVHGDLRLEHVFLFPEQTAPNDIVIIDGIEFSESLRCIDVVADIAFLVMELSYSGRRDLARDFASVYFSETNDNEGSRLLPLFAVYRSAVRAKVAAILSMEAETAESDRQLAISRSRAHWLWCLSEMEEPDRRPALVLISGLPGTGKSTLSRQLMNEAHSELLRSDVIRKEIFANAPATTNAAVLYSDSMYSETNTQRVYDECRKRSRARLLAGGRVIVDATFQRDSDRRTFLQMAIDSGVRAVWLECVASPDIVQRRLENRRGDASDADWSVYKLIQRNWEPPSEFTRMFHHSVETDSDSALKSACSILKSNGLRQ
jgi:aminoglycoside phosphotransferase family enzyme/predicted kinase